LLSVSSSERLLFPACLSSPAQESSPFNALGLGFLGGLGVFLFFDDFKMEKGLFSASASGVAVSVEDLLDRFPGDGLIEEGGFGETLPEGGIFWFLVGRTAEICFCFTGVDNNFPLSAAQELII
jgi:hypothetical protein